MSVQIRYFIDPASSDGFLPDVAIALRAARAAGDTAAANMLYRVWLDHLGETLASKSAPALKRYLSSRVWTMVDGFPLFRTSGPPFVAYTAYDRADGTTRVFALAACYQLPGGGEAQWASSVIAPRLVAARRLRIL
ncbi:hypothetical protein L6Q21_09495 [Sandaracinobacter sp. RS1-74]|uniref:hypothetical protein n=1 Tax=Sandaracinobacteroides sayramensis TaxID=2913411 RepID=UPI001EDA3EA0|nr:hypothetical protein [Sandaracinobacteroides sayramensis]MCG2841212.1 hypothetical protein [Sandaracinobacteroides sayramensis]